MEQLLERHQGTVTIRDREARLRGIIDGDLRVEGNSQVDFDGIVRGSVTLSGGSLHLRGVVRNNVSNHGGKLTISGGLIKGRIRNHAGETVIGEGSLVGRSAQ